jgi:hypothetical protein
VGERHQHSFRGKKVYIRQKRSDAQRPTAPFLRTALQTYAMDSVEETKSEGLPISPLLRLPFEIRLIIYEYLLLPSTTPSTGQGTSVANLIPDAFHTYYSEDTNNDPCTLSVRTIDPWLGAQGSRSWGRRSTYYVRTGKSHSSLMELRHKRSKRQGLDYTCILRGGCLEDMRKHTNFTYQDPS